MIEEARHILLVEDDDNLGYVLKEYLGMNGLKVTWAKNGDEGKMLFDRDCFDLCLLDVMMPKKDGFTLAAEIKYKNPLFPIIFLTAKSLKVDKLKGFNLGADDYIVKPIDEEELVARIKAVIRRSVQSPTDNDLLEYAIGSYTYNPHERTLSKNNHRQVLSERENEILHNLCLHKGKLVERKVMLNRIWGHADYFNRRSMDVIISRIRKYLEGDPLVRIVNVHGKGFVLQDG